jgi:hypothetical protein
MCCRKTKPHKYECKHEHPNLIQTRWNCSMPLDRSSTVA